MDDGELIFYREAMLSPLAEHSGAKPRWMAQKYPEILRVSEVEMRVAILIKKACQEGIQLSDDVAFFVAKHLRSNVRELEGALRKILLQRFTKAKRTVF